MKSKLIYILEDEALIAEHLEILLTGMGYERIECFLDPEELIDRIGKEKPSLVILDINLNADLDGVDVAGMLNNNGIPFIYLTSNSDPRTLSRVKHTKPRAFILKPFQEESIKANLALVFHELKTNEVEEVDNIFVKKKHELIKIQLDEIVRVEALDSYAIIYTETEKMYYSYPLKQLEEKLPSEDFFRTHRSHLVRLKSIDKILPKSVVVGGTEVPLSERKRSELLERIKLL
ncbi:MAG: LytR/AlgR family response regulator transcription factor [Crocinitomicaceae bacterium]